MQREKIELNQTLSYVPMYWVACITLELFKSKRIVSLPEHSALQPQLLNVDCYEVGVR